MQMRRVREVEEDQRKEGGGETKKRKRRAAFYMQLYLTPLVNSFQFMSHIAVCIFMLHYISVIYFTEKTQGENVHLGIVLLRW